MTRSCLLLLFGLACVAGGIFTVPTPASAKCAPGDDRCLGRCAAWNNWCRPACGDWNGHCAGQSLPQVISRMSPRSFFADPWYYGQRYETPYEEPRWQGNAPPHKTQARKAGSAKSSAASAR